MSARAAKHASWIAAPARSFDPYDRSYVGALSVKGVLELGKQGIDVSDQVVRDLDIPIMQTALDLLDKVYAIADGLGVGPEVRAAITAIRGAEYAGGVASAVVGPAATGAAAGIFVGIGGIAALGAIGVVALALSELFGGGDEEAADKARKRAQADVLHLRDRLTLAEFAAEQDLTAQHEAALAIVPWLNMAEHKAAAARAAKLAEFYRTSQKALTKKEAALFESLSNLARWTAVLSAYGKLGQSKKDAIDVMFGTSAPRLPYQLKAPIEAETKRLGALTTAVESDRPKGPSTITTILVVLAAGAGIYAGVRPASAAKLASSVASKVTGAARAGAAKARGILP